MKFQDLKIGLIFFCNGVKYRKVSTRTALMIHVNKRFYFGMNEICKILNGRIIEAK